MAYYDLDYLFAIGVIKHCAACSEVNIFSFIITE